MRIAPYLLSAALLASAPAFAETASTAPASPTVTPVAQHMAAAPAATPASAKTTNAPPNFATVPVAPAATPATASADALTDAQKTAVEEVVKNYLTQKNPEVLMEAMQELQKRQLADNQAKSKAALATDHDKLYADATSPVGGNPKGDVTIIEFFDYQCGYCKMSEPTIEKLIKEDKNVKFVYKDFPVLGPSSTLAAKAAIASVRQNKYQQFHDALMAAKFSHGANPKADEDTIYNTAKQVGLDVNKLKKDMDDAEINKIVEANVALGTEVGARGTPTFIIGEQMFPGAMELPQLKKAVEEARASGSKPAATPATTPSAAPTPAPTKKP